MLIMVVKIMFKIHTIIPISLNVMLNYEQLLLNNYRDMY